MPEIATTDTVTFTDSTTINTVTTQSDTITFTDSVTIKTTATQSDTITFTDNIIIRTVATQSDTITFTDKAVLTTVKTHADILRFYETIRIERVKDNVVLESRTITYPERVTVMNLDLLFDALALTVRELGVKMGENARDIGTVFLAGTFGVEAIKITNDVKLMLRRTIEDMIRAMKG